MIDASEETMTTEAPLEQALAEVKNVLVENIGKGRLSLTNKRIMFEKKNSLFSSPQLELSVYLADVAAARVRDSSSTLILEWCAENGERSTSRMRLSPGEAAAGFCRDLKNMLEKLRRETERKELESRYRRFVWTTASHIWHTVHSLFEIQWGLIQEDWDSVDIHASNLEIMANRLLETGAIDITLPVKAINESAPRRDAPPVLRKIAATLQAISSDLVKEVPEPEEFARVVCDDDEEFGWRDLRYLFLFAARYRLAYIRHLLGDEKHVTDALSRLKQAVVLLSLRLPLNEDQPTFEGEISQQMEQIDQFSKNVENHLVMNAGVT